MTDNPTLTDAARRMLDALNGPRDAELVEALLTGNAATQRAARDMITRYNAAAEAAQERPEWVRVSDVPEEWKDGRPCLIYRPDGNPLVCEDWFMDDSDGWLKGTTHVMPMPKGPSDCIPTVTIPRPIVATHNPNGGHLVLTFRNDEDLEAAMKELGCDPR